MELKEQKK